MAGEQSPGALDLLAQQIEQAKRRREQAQETAVQPPAAAVAPAAPPQTTPASLDTLRQLILQKQQQAKPAVPATPAAEVPQPPAQPPAVPAGATDKLKEMLERARQNRPAPQKTAPIPKGPREPKLPEPPGRGLVTRPIDQDNPARPPDSDDFAPETPVEVRPLGVVSQETGKPLYAAVGDTYAQRALLWAAGFKYGPVEFQPPLRKRGERQKGWSKRDLWYTDQPEVKAKLENALNNPSDPLNASAAARQDFLEQRDEERRKMRDEAQARADAAPDDHYTQEGYSVDEHVRSYADKPKRPVNVPLPDGLQLEPYQQAAVEFIQEKFDPSRKPEERGAMLADIPGLGKTMPAIGIINGDEAIRQVLIVCPAVMRKTWLDELSKWLAGPTRRNPDGSLKTRVRVVWGKEWPQDGDIFIINYENLPGHEQHIHGTHWDYVVMDESHRLKNEKGLRAAVILGGQDKKGNQHGGITADRRLLLTGTPIPRTTWELYANLRFLRPDVYNNAQDFVDTFAKQRVILRTWAEKQADGSFEQRQSYRRVPTSPKNIELLNRILFGGGTRQGPDGTARFDGVAMRRMRSDLGPEHQLPPLKERFHLVGRGDEDPDLHSHDAELHKLMDDVEHAETLDDRAEAEMRFEAAARASFDEVTKKRKEAGAAKVDYAVKMAIGIAMHDELNPRPDPRPSKVIVFAYHHEVVHDIAEKLKAACKSMGKPWTVAVTYGKTPAAERDRKFADVRGDQNTRFLVASYPVLREGITLTAVDHVIHAELSPNPVDHEQATARAWRKGQDRPVTSHYVVRRGTIDERLMEILREKNTAVQQALNFRY